MQPTAIIQDALRPYHASSLADVIAEYLTYAEIERGWTEQTRLCIGHMRLFFWCSPCILRSLLLLIVPWPFLLSKARAPLLRRVGN